MAAGGGQPALHAGLRGRTLTVAQGFVAGRTGFTSRRPPEQTVKRPGLRPGNVTATVIESYESGGVSLSWPAISQGGWTSSQLIAMYACPGTGWPAVMGPVSGGSATADKGVSGGKNDLVVHRTVVGRGRPSESSSWMPA